MVEVFAILRTGGKQFKVSTSEKLAIQKISGNVGDVVKLEDVLMKHDDSGIDYSAEKSFVMAKILDQYREKKVIIFKKNRRHNYRRKKGHRQEMTFIQIESIN